MPTETLVATVPGHEWVTLRNPDPIRSLNRTLSFGDTCSIKEGGTVSVIASATPNTYLVRYYAPKESGEPAGACCPTGGIFLVSKERFSTMTQEYNNKVAARQAEIDLVRALLDQ